MVWIGSGSVWIGLDPGLDRPRIGPTFLCMLRRGPIVTRKGRQGGPGLTTVSVWQFDSLDVQQLQLGCWTA